MNSEQCLLEIVALTSRLNRILKLSRFSLSLISLFLASLSLIFFIWSASREFLTFPFYSISCWRRLDFFCSSVPVIVVFFVVIRIDLLYLFSWFHVSQLRLCTLLSCFFLAVALLLLWLFSSLSFFDNSLWNYSADSMVVLGISVAYGILSVAVSFAENVWIPMFCSSYVLVASYFLFPLYPVLLKFVMFGMCCWPAEFFISFTVKLVVILPSRGSVETSIA